MVKFQFDAWTQGAKTTIHKCTVLRNSAWAYSLNWFQGGKKTFKLCLKVILFF